jgi:hypothetical protein
MHDHGVKIVIFSHGTISQSGQEFNHFMLRGVVGYVGLNIIEITGRGSFVPEWAALVEHTPM